MTTSALSRFFIASQNFARNIDRNIVWTAVLASVCLHFLAMFVMHDSDSNSIKPAAPKPVARVRILANPNGKPNASPTKAVEIAKPKPKPKKANTRAIVKQETREEQAPAPTNTAPQSFGDDLTGGVVGTGLSTTDGSSDPGITANAEPIERIKPDFPREAALKGIEGWVLMRFDITEEGSVEHVEIVDANPRGLFDRKAKEAIRKWKYAPRMSNGQPVKLIGREVQLDFKLEN